MDHDPSFSELLRDRTVVKWIAIFIGTSIVGGLVSAGIQIVAEEITDQRRIARKYKAWKKAQSK